MIVFHLIAAVSIMTHKLENGVYWNGKAKAMKLRAAVRTINNNDTPEIAYNKVHEALSWQRWFTLFQSPSRKPPKNTLQVMLNAGHRDLRRK